MVTMLPESRASFQLQLLKVGKGSLAEFVLQREEPLWIKTHWLNGRQAVCPAACLPDVDCPACVEQIPRVSGFLVVAQLVAGRMRPFLFEVSDSSWARLRMLCQMEKLEPSAGLMVCARRQSFNRPISLEPVGLSKGGVIDALAGWRKVAGAVAVVFRLPLPEPGHEVSDWAASCEPFARVTVVRGLAKLS